MKRISLYSKHLTSIVLMTLGFSFLLVGQTEDSRQRIIPKSPEAATFDKFINFPAVSGTGIPQIQIPLYTLQYKGYSFPISLSYHSSGIKVDDIATPVGLNWVLNANYSISRNICGLPDEYGWFSFDTTAAQSCIFDNVRPFYEGVYDAAPDVFSYVLPGHSGKFFFKADSSIIKSSADPIRIDDDFNFYYNNRTCLNFTIYDEYGNKYSFLPLGRTAIDVYDNKGGVSSSLDHLNGSGLVEWKLDKITLPGGYEILFTYEPYNYGVSWDDKTTSYYVMLEELLHCSAPTEFYGGFSSIEANYQTHLLKTIKTAEQKVIFDYDTDPTLSIMKKKLKQISIIDSVSGTNDTVQIIKLNYGKYSGDPRLKLLAVEFLGDNSYNSSKSLKYTCSYSEVSLPP